MAHDRGQVRGDVHLAVADPDDQRGAVAGHHHAVGEVGVHDGETPGALDLGERVDDLGLQTVRGRRSDEVGEDLGVGVTDQLDAGLGEPFPQRGGVVDDPVVDDRDPAVGRGVRMGVGVVGRTVRRPPGVPDADLAGGPLRQRIHQIAYAARLLHHLEPAAQHGDARRVVAAVLQPGQPLGEQAGCLLGPDVANDSAHVSCPSYP